MSAVFCHGLPRDPESKYVSALQFTEFWQIAVAQFPDPQGAPAEADSLKSPDSVTPSWIAAIDALFARAEATDDPDPAHSMALGTQARLLPHLDRAMSTLVSDLPERGLLDETLVVMMGEMGARPVSTTPPATSRPAL